MDGSANCVRTTRMGLASVYGMRTGGFEKSGYWSSHGEENACYHVKEHKKLGQKLVSKVTLHFVWGNLWKKQTVQCVNIFLS